MTISVPGHPWADAGARTPAERPEPAVDDTPTAVLAAGFWRSFADVAAGGAPGADGAGDPDLVAALDDLASSGDEVVGRIALGRVGLPRSGGEPALRSVAVDDVRRPFRS